MAMLDELAWQIYQTIDPEQLLPEGERRRMRRRMAERSEYRYIRSDQLPKITMERGGPAPAMVQAVWMHARPHTTPGHSGRLLTALLERQRSMHADGRSLLAWLTSVFSHLTQNIGGRIRQRKMKEGCMMKYYIDGCEIKSVMRVPMRSDGSYVVRFPHDALLSQLEAINWDKPTIVLNEPRDTNKAYLPTGCGFLLDHLTYSSRPGNGRRKSGWRAVSR